VLWIAYNRTPGSGNGLVVLPKLNAIDRDTDPGVIIEGIKWAQPERTVKGLFGQLWFLPVEINPSFIAPSGGRVNVGLKGAVGY
jgi:hypothetical protein